jgi:hypothetical protein
MKTLAVVAGTLLVNVPEKNLKNYNYTSDQYRIELPTGDLKPQTTQLGLRILVLFGSFLFLSFLSCEFWY